MKTIEDWSLTQHANIVGICDGKPIRTSRVVFRSGAVVITESGSNYCLGSPQKDFANRRTLGRLFACETPLQAVDVQYQRVAELMEKSE